MNTPEWLSARGGALKLGSDRKTWFVIFNGRPDYSLVALPAAGKFTCTLRQTINGQRLESPGAHATSEAALAAGLESLRQRLGWG